MAFAALVAYLSFVPFRYQPLEFDEALRRFAHIPYLNLGAGNRADWVANILMFLPLGWFGAAFFVPRPRGRFDLVAIVPALILGAAWAVAVEFGQLYFPNRTVSINDIVAEVIGTFLGAWMWSAFGAHSLDWWRTLLRGGRATANAVLAAYLLAYLVLSFSPFDFIISGGELAEKAASDLNGWWLAPIGCGRTPCSAKLLAEALAVLPLGWWLAMRRGGGPGSITAAAVIGAGLGALIELAQFFLVSGTSQGASAVARMAGVAAGAWVHSVRRRITGIDWARWGRPLVLVGSAPWLLAVAYVSGWFSGRWMGIDAGLARLEGVEWMPLFYQYYSTEQALIRSTLVHLVLYAPVGAAVWLWGRRTNSASALAAAALAAAIALVAETGKLFVQGKHPDYTDVLFAVVAAWTAATLLRWASNAVRGAVDAAVSGGSSPARIASRTARSPTLSTPARAVNVGPLGGFPPPPPEAALVPGLTPSWTARPLAVGLFLLAAVSVVRFPIWQLPLAVGLAAYAVLLARQPLAYLLVVPAALPLLDLATFSGRFFWDEFDLLIVTTLAVRLLMAQPPELAKPPWPKFGLSLLALSVVAGTAIALWPPAPLDANAFTNYLSQYNALRVAKGYLWGGVLLWLIWRDAAAGRDVAARLQLGLGLGLLAAVIGVFSERWLFVGFDLGAWFRAAGFVSATHVGGAYLEAILVMLTPFALSLAVSARRVAIGVLWFGVALLGAAAILMTLSRAAAVAWLIAVASFAVLWWFGSHRSESSRAGWRWQFTALAALAALIGAGVLMAQSTSLRDRLAASGSDLGVRLAHWRTTVDLMRRDPLHVLFGMGLGSFPREFYISQAATTRLAAYRLDREPGTGRHFLSLVGGRGMYLDQRVEAEPGRSLRLRGQARASAGGAELAVGLCEKSFLASVRCDWARVPAGLDWDGFEVALRLPESRADSMRRAVPVSLSLHNGGSGTRIDVTQLSLRDGSEERLANGSFDQGLDHWLMHSDAHLAWRAHNTWLQIAFEQGIVGVLAWLSIAVVGAGAIARGRTNSAAAAGAGLVAFAAVGMFDTLLDWERTTMLVALVAGTLSVARNSASGVG